MKYQRSSWSCGAAAVVNAIRVFGTKVSEYKVRGLAGTTKEGTDEVGIMNAVRALGFTAAPYTSDSSNNAFQWISGQLIHGSPVILCLDAWLHWAVAVGYLGDRVVVIDSSNFSINKKENGVHIFTKNQLMRRWKNSRKSVTEDRLYAIVVGKK